ncbi:MAG: aldolase [Rhodobacteraceae bacterium]|nr:aldolase [Paracoccaceae bacterium]
MTADNTSDMKFLMIVNDPEIAAFVAGNGVDRLFVDLEFEGKEARQGHLSSWISRHTSEDVTKVREAAPDAHLLVRINPLNAASRNEIKDAISRGADSIMLPMFNSREEVDRFMELIAGRCLAVPLVETGAALQALPEIAERCGLSEIYIGLNDLHLDLGLDFMFEPFANGLLEDPCAALREAGVKFGIGGLARDGEGIVSPKYLLGEHVRLGSTRAILSRTFHRGARSVAEMQSEMDFAEEVGRLAARYHGFQNMPLAELNANRAKTADKISDVVHLIKSKKSN